MKIRYRNTIEDAISFNKYHHANSKTLKKQRVTAAVYIPLVLAVLIGCFYLIRREMTILVWGSVFIAIYLFLIDRAYRRGMYKSIQKIYEEQDTDGFCCEHELEIDEEGLTERTEMNEHRVKWTGVPKIGTDNDYAFVYIGPIQAHIIPKNRIIEGEFEKFTEKAKAFWEESRAKKTEVAGKGRLQD